MLLIVVMDVCRGLAGVWSHAFWCAGANGCLWVGMREFFVLRMRDVVDCLVYGLTLCVHMISAVLGCGNVRF